MKRTDKRQEITMMTVILSTKRLLILQLVLWQHLDETLGKISAWPNRTILYVVTTSTRLSAYRK